MVAAEASGGAGRCCSKQDGAVPVRDLPGATPLPLRVSPPRTQGLRCAAVESEAAQPVSLPARAAPRDADVRPRSVLLARLPASLPSPLDRRALLLLLVVGVGLPVVVAAISGSLLIPHNDDFNYRRVA